MSLVEIDDDELPLTFPVILSATLLWFSTACSGQTVRIRVVNVTSGNPIREQPVAISLLQKGGSTAKAQTVAILFSRR
jgi:hypothetical protein